MTKLYVEPFSGISGNMFMGALFDLGASFPHVKAELAKLDLGQYKLIYEKVEKCGIMATHFDVELPEEHQHTHDHHDHDHDHEHHDHEHHDHEHHDHEHHDHEHHDHEHHDHEHGHHHEQGSSLINAQPQVHTHAHAHRNLADILGIINHSALSQEIKTKAAEVFTALGKAEAKVHGKSLEEIHFHEVGAIDTIIDIVGALLALEDLGVTEIYVGKMQTGRGFVRCAHGLMPIPAPATAELLQTIPCYQGELDKELVTPTGAALMYTLAKVAMDKPSGFSSAAIGYGAGTWDLPIPNVVRLYLAKDEANEDSASGLVVAECNLDDTTGEICGYVLSELLAKGALDAWYTPIYMKKNRPAAKLSLLCSRDKLKELEQVIFQETSTLGLRYFSVERTALDREIQNVQLPWGSVKIKVGYYEGHVVNVAPEYADCVKLAADAGVPLKEIMQAAVEEGKKIAHS